MPIFSEMQRSFTGPRAYAEPQFDYLDRSARPEAERVRAAMEAWYRPFLDDNDDLRNRLRSPDDVQFLGAAFELYIFALLGGLGYQIEVHPEAGGGRATRPDFLITDRNGHSQYVEVTLATDTSQQARAASTRMAHVYDAINRIKCANFYLHLDIDGKPRTSPRTRKLQRDLEAWLDSLDADRIAQQITNSDRSALPTFTWQHEDCRIEFQALPRSPNRRGDLSARVIGIMSTGAHWVATWLAIRNSVLAKGQRYGKLDKPLVVAVSANEFNVDRIDEMQALFGQEQFVFVRGEEEPRMERAGNGVWRGPKGIRYKRISAVLIAAAFTPWHAGMRKITLYKNPWTELPVQGPICDLSAAVPEKSGKMSWREGVHPREVLGLPAGWPETAA